MTSVTESTFAGNSADGRGGTILHEQGKHADVGQLDPDRQFRRRQRDRGHRSQPSVRDHLARHDRGRQLRDRFTGHAVPTSPAPSRATSDYNLIGDGSHTNLMNGSNGNLVGTDLQPINARLGPLGNYGGPTPTIPLLPGSPAIDAGSNALAANPNGDPLTTDQRGEPRAVERRRRYRRLREPGLHFTPGQREHTAVGKRRLGVR